jgi:NADH dehydrogenase subunit C (EC 1.6.5.3)/NADH dehydrogenase subunit D (EC 1.6.5.3)
MKRQGANEDYMFLNLGPNHPSAHGAFRIVLQLDGEEIVDCVRTSATTTVAPRKWPSASPGTASSPTPTVSTTSAG